MWSTCQKITLKNPDSYNNHHLLMRFTILYFSGTSITKVGYVSAEVSEYVNVHQLLLFVLFSFLYIVCIIPLWEA